MNQKILLVTPPFVQLNTPYPATTYLKGYLNTIGIEVHQIDLGIEVILDLFSNKGLTDLFEKVQSSETSISNNAKRILKMKTDYINTIDAVISFLQNKNPTLAYNICSQNYLPEASRFQQAKEVDWAFGNMGTHDKARHLATLYLEDISDFIIETIDSHFGFTRYAEKISVAASSFDDLYETLKQPDTFIDSIMLKLLRMKIDCFQPTVVGLSVPFPGNLYSALKCGQWIKNCHPEIKLIIGGGYPNTELRSVTDTRVFEFVDYITLDDGEAPLHHLIEYFDGLRAAEKLKRTFRLNKGIVVYENGSEEMDIPQRETGTPDYSDLPLEGYLSVIETANPMHRLWSDGRWNKLIMAHGCYWGRCTFCDTSLDYIGRFEPNTAHVICDRMEQIIAQTGQTGFHFVDEAAPPALMKSLALEIIKRKLNVTWWTNIRFEKSFTYDVCFLLKKSGCIAVSGGLEVASNRLLGLINKGVSVEQAANSMNNFSKAGIMVHAYLMYGFPTQTAHETIDSLEVVRQLFEMGIVQSGFWHHFAMTAHSPVGLNPEKFLVKKANEPIGAFANNELVCIDTKGTNHAAFGEGLRKALYNYMHSTGFDYNLQQWFNFKIPKTSVRPNHIRDSIMMSNYQPVSPSARVVWLGFSPEIEATQGVGKKKGQDMAILRVVSSHEVIVLKMKRDEAIWLKEALDMISFEKSPKKNYSELEEDFKNKFETDFILFWNSKNIQKLREVGLVVL